MKSLVGIGGRFSVSVNTGSTPKPAFRTRAAVRVRGEFRSNVVGRP
ncbi:MAG: hypothetical protein LWW93_15070 [Hyphomicrobiales bacterium]|nr:hypothetical protein [Hyphomicrobiales bacterium]